MLQIFVKYIKMSKDSLAKYYQNNNEKLQKNPHEITRGLGEWSRKDRASIKNSLI